jgi:hypothetical protein
MGPKNTSACKSLRLALAIHPVTCAVGGCELRSLPDFLTELVEYLDDRMDVDEPSPGVRIPNEAARLLVQAEALLSSLQPEPPAPSATVEQLREMVAQGPHRFVPGSGFGSMQCALCRHYEHAPSHAPVETAEGRE